MIFAKSFFLLRKALPFYPSSAPTKTVMNIQERISRRHSSSTPALIAPLFQYASECYVTQGLQLLMEGLNGTGLSWPCVFVVSGFALRIVSSPFHILAEKLFAQRLHAENYLTAAILNKLGQYHKVEVGPNESRSKLELKTSDPKIVAHSERLMNEIISQYMLDNRLQISRIQNLKICTVPFWVFSSFAVRNIISSDFHPSIPGGLWVTNMLAPDPYFILPFFVGIFGFLNLYTQKKLYFLSKITWKTRCYNYTLGLFTFFAVIIVSQLPACIPLYWISVSFSGFVQTQFLRHPTVKRFLGIKRLPTDSQTPIRDLFLSKRV